MKSKYEDVIARITPTTHLKDARDCDLIIEAIIEQKNIKVDFYRDLGPIIQESAIFASNTSSLAVTDMALASGRPDKFVGLHFFNPVQVVLTVVSAHVFYFIYFLFYSILFDFVR